MNYTELTIHTTTEASEIVADVMWNYTDYGVTVCDSKDIIALEQNKDGLFWDYMDDHLKEISSDVLVKCYLPDTPEGKRAIQDILTDLFRARENAQGEIPFGTLEDVKRPVVGEDWVEVWKKHFRPIPLGKIVVVPEWTAYEAKEGEEVVLLDSNMAFGTGEHETTSQCIELIEKYLRAGDVCVDVGCGSGILGISALKLGAKKVYFSDVDPIAVKSAIHNAKLNGVEERAVVCLSDLIGEESEPADLLFANITGEILARLAPNAAKALKKKGKVILSGIIESRLSFVKRAYEEVGLYVIEERKKGDWYALALEGKED